jgi:hypothetical protein
VVEPEESPCDDITRRKPFACHITKATYTLSEHVVFIAFPRQQWFRERVSLWRYTYIASLVNVTACGVCRYFSAVNK